MNILMDLSHPAHFHLLRNTYFQLLKTGHKIIVTVKNEPAIIELLKSYKIDFIVLGNKSDLLILKGFKQIIYNFKLWYLVLKYKITLGFSSSFTMTQIALFTPMDAILLDDDDDDVEPLVAKFGHPFAKAVLSPDCVNRKTKNLITYKGYHELAYLHPNCFQPDVEVLDELGIGRNEIYYVLRFNAFKAHHDVGIKGISLENKRKLINLLESRGRVFITTEREIDDEFKKYLIKIPSEKIHSLLFFATMFVGDSQTMTSEAAVLGTPAIRCNSFVGRISYLEELEHKYQLAYGFKTTEVEQMFVKIQNLLSLPNLKHIWGDKRKEMLKDKIDVTDFYIRFIQNYPKSLQK